MYAEKKEALLYSFVFDHAVYAVKCIDRLTPIGFPRHFMTEIRMKSESVVKEFPYTAGAELLIFNDCMGDLTLEPACEKSLALCRVKKCDNLL